MIINNCIQLELRYSIWTLSGYQTNDKQVQKSLLRSWFWLVFKCNANNCLCGQLSKFFGAVLKRSLRLLLLTLVLSNPQVYCIFPNKWMCLILVHVFLCHCAAVCEICDPWSWRFGLHGRSWGWDECVCHTISVCTKGTVTWNQGVCMCACVCEKGDNALDEPWNYSHGWGLLTSLFTSVWLIKCVLPGFFLSYTFKSVLVV